MTTRRVELVDAINLDRHVCEIGDHNHLTDGGEAEVYKEDPWVIKIYNNPNRYTEDNLFEKIKMLASLKSHCDDIATPLGYVRENNQYVGCYSRFVDGVSLGLASGNKYRRQNGLNLEHARVIAERMRRIVSFAHTNGVVLADANENNWIVARYTHPHAIDVDSWIIDANHMAHAIAPTIRDWHGSMVFCPAADWFAWAVTTFQLFTGIHPYAGSHPDYVSYEDLVSHGQVDPQDAYIAGSDDKLLIIRMQHNVSVFNDDTIMPRGARLEIPVELLGWYEAVFENCERSSPPQFLGRKTTKPRLNRASPATWQLPKSVASRWQLPKRGL